MFEWRYFNPRSLVGNDILNADVGNSTKDFNPRSLVGNDTLYPHPLPELGISIHVPSWGTTILCGLMFGEILNFNPRSLVGNDWGAREIRAKRSISIHVPSWGTTLDGWKKSCADVKFQSTFPRGERHESSDTGPLPFKFQSTFPRGERPDGLRQFVIAQKFQSTFPRGERQYCNFVNGII